MNAYMKHEEAAKTMLVIVWAHLFIGQQRAELWGWQDVVSLLQWISIENVTEVLRVDPELQ